MAFKATKKPTSKKAASTIKEEEVISQTSVSESSIDDFIGAPQVQSVDMASSQQEKPVVTEQPVQVKQPEPMPRQEQYQEQPRRYQQHHTGNQGNYGNQGGYGSQGGYGNQGNSGNQGNYGNQGGYGSQGGYGNQGNSGNQGNYGNGGGYRQQRYGGYNRRPPMRRDFSSAENGMQDISVPTETVKGLLDVMPEGHGFLRPKFTPSDKDVYISQSQIRRFLLRNGDMVEGQARSPKENERYWGLLKVEKINEQPAELMQQRPRFDDLIAIYPNKLLKLETGNIPLSTRIIDLVAPIGFGQRGMIVSPPKAGKTTIIKELATGISQNFPDVHLMAALIGERPEEVTDISRSVKGEVLASNFDESPQEQTRIAEVALDRAKRLVEMGKDVVILLDSITRLARAYNLVVNPSGRTLSGGFDPAALYPAKKFLGAARCVEAPLDNAGQPIGKGGSLTVIGTALVDTGSRMDDLIYEEFKGTGNMELHLSRLLQERRIFPAIDIGKSGTRHDELLLGEENMGRVTTLRHMLSLLSDEERTQMLIDRLKKTETNQEFIDSLSKGD